MNQWRRKEKKTNLTRQIIVTTLTVIYT